MKIDWQRLEHQLAHPEPITRWQRLQMALLPRRYWWAVLIQRYF